MQKEKYALLDTDFISKMYMIQKNADSHLIDNIMEMPGYRFYCHNQIRAELSRHNVPSAVEWLEDRISSGKIKCYRDENILNELESVYGEMACGLYADLLKKACQAYSEGYYESGFGELQKIDYGKISKPEFMEKLNVDCDIIGSGNNLGEIKTYVLLQMLLLMSGEQIYVFCSDDRNARNGIISIGGIKCISVLSAFVRLKKECNFGWEMAKGYVDSWLAFCAAHNQTTFKVRENSKVPRMCRVSCEQVMKEIFEDKFEETRKGDLRYKI